MTANIIHKRLNVLLVGLALIGIGFLVSYGTATAVKKPKTTADPRDLRHEQAGQWNCNGVTTVPYGVERPFHGALRNEWTLDQQWLVIRFEEKYPVTELPLREEQYWTYSAATNTHTRLLLTNEGAYAVLTSKGWEDNVLSWQGSYIVEGVALDVKETTVRLSPDHYRWFATVKQNGTTVASYSFICVHR
jgi:hypothetical protein